MAARRLGRAKRRRERPIHTAWREVRRHDDLNTLPGAIRFVLGR